jgi:Family of unknown function (DUF6326)
MANKVFEDIKINIKIKLAALWTALMFCYVYGDFFSLFVPGRIQHLMDGNSGAGETTPITLLLYAALLSLPALMILLSVILKARPNRILNITLGIFYTLVMIMVVITSLGEWMIFYTFLGVVEIILTCTIVWQAIKWPTLKP